MCVREGSDDIVAINATFISSKDDKVFQQLISSSKSKDVINFYKIIKMFYEKVPVFDKYNADCYMASLGLSVNPKYRGLGIGQKMLQAR